MSKRLFLAIPLSEEIKRKVREKRAIIDPELKWIPEENLHITLHFFGSTQEETIPPLIHTLSKVIQSFQAFQLFTKEIGTQSGKFEKMLWVKFINTPEFVELSRAIARDLSINLSRKPLPHINLIRMKNTRYFLNNTALPMILNEEVKVEQVELWESDLRPAKFPIYKALYMFKLNEREKK
jgi:RNA 2',3'-cyclic 3'-phosphodiesterase